MKTPFLQVITLIASALLFLSCQKTGDIADENDTSSISGKISVKKGSILSLSEITLKTGIVKIEATNNGKNDLHY